MSTGMRSKHRLALRLGMMVADLERMSVDEYNGWMTFFTLEERDRGQG